MEMHTQRTFNSRLHFAPAVLGLVCLCGGCGGQGGEGDAAKKEPPKSAKGLQDFMKKNFANPRNLKGKMQRGTPGAK
jgi:hypothetical protein